MFKNIPNDVELIIWNIFTRVKYECCIKSIKRSA